jgi:two-component system chemotaxis response regulator CheB
MAETIKVLIVDDSVFMRKVIMDVLNKENDIEVIDIAKDGQEAVEKAISIKPDVITMDVEMPVLDGISSLEKILDDHFVPVIMFSSVTVKGADRTMKALEIGAVDFITKPSSIFDIKGNPIEKELVSKIRAAFKVKNIKKTKEKTPQKVQKSKKSDIVKSRKIEKIIAVGSSTGGPKALHSFIPYLPGDISAPVVIVQHMPPGFTKSLAERLNTISEVNVVEARNNDILSAGVVYIAPGGYHMVFRKGHGDNIKIKLTKDAPVGGHRPCVDVMMESLSEVAHKDIIGVIMTGMGGDGSKGIVELKNRKKSYIIAQNEETCVVFGMPKVAISTGLVDCVVPLEEISNKIVEVLGV